MMPVPPQRHQSSASRLQSSSCPAEIMPFSSGLKRNIVQCLNDYDIPLRYSTTVTRVTGKNRLTGVYVAPVDEKMNPLLEKEEYIPCDTLLLSVGLIPENDLLTGTSVEMSRVTSGAVVDEFRQTSVPVRALVWLTQAKENRIEPMDPVQAMTVMLKQAMMPVWDDGAMDGATALMGRLAQELPMFHLRCRPDEAAARRPSKGKTRTPSGTWWTAPPFCEG